MLVDVSTALGKYMDGRSRFKFSAAERTIEIEGSEAFVSQQIAEMREVISFFITQEPTPSSSQPMVTVTDVKTTETITASISQISERQPLGIEAFPNTFDSLDGAVKLIAEIPGDSKKTSTRNAALMYGYACSLQGRDTYPSDEVRDICLNHGFLDNANFSKSFDDKKLFIIGGVRGGKKTLKLTMAGKKLALQLIEEIEANAN
ncbi:hypothetical protein ACYZUC_01775 [Pseudomonas sp. GT1P32]